MRRKTKRSFYFISFLFSILIFAILVYSYGGTNPAVHGHDEGELSVDAIPSGFCMFSETQNSCPTGWSRASNFDARTIYGSSSPGSNGGSASHTHTVSSHRHYVSGNTASAGAHTHSLGNWGGDYGCGNSEGCGGQTPSTANSNGAHSHSVGIYTNYQSPGTSSTNSWSPYRTVLICCKD